MSGLRGVLVGVLSLTTLELVLGSDYATNNAGTFFDLAGRTAQALISPAVPAIPDRRQGETYGVAQASAKPTGERQAPPAPAAQQRLNPTVRAQPPVEPSPTPQPGPAPHP